jgi:hypothetical protein
MGTGLPHAALSAGFAAIVVLIGAAAVRADVPPRNPQQDIVFEGVLLERHMLHPPCGRVASGGWATFRVERVIAGQVTGETVRVVLMCPEMTRVGQRYRMTVRAVPPRMGPLSVRQVPAPADAIRTYWARSRREVRR